MADDDFKDFLRALSAADVKYLVVGAYAMAAHGYVRATGDLDTWIEPTLANAEHLGVAIRDFAGTSLAFFGVSVEELAERAIGFYMGVEPDRIDVHTAIAGVTFTEAWSGRVSSQTFGVQTDVLGLDELIAAKRAAIVLRPKGSSKALQDAADLAWLETERSRRLAATRGPA